MGSRLYPAVHNAYYIDLFGSVAFYSEPNLINECIHIPDIYKVIANP